MKISSKLHEYLDAERAFIESNWEDEDIDHQSVAIWNELTKEKRDWLGKRTLRVLDALYGDLRQWREGGN